MRGIEAIRRLVSVESHQQRRELRSSATPPKLADRVHLAPWAQVEDGHDVSPCRIRHGGRDPLEGIDDLDSVHRLTRYVTRGGDDIGRKSEAHL